MKKWSDPVFFTIDISDTSHNPKKFEYPDGSMTGHKKKPSDPTAGPTDIPIPDVDSLS
ncbi:MAG: hypothetical protein K5744_12325 [Eubacterium sp.]|nr:hypothetical protein [Eubacterium sp.]